MTTVTSSETETPSFRSPEPRWVRASTPPGPDPFAGSDLDPRLAEMLRRRGVESVEEADRFLEPDLDHLHPLDGLAGLEEALVLLDEVRKAKKPVYVVGDYDVDGVTATALLTATLRACGVAVEPVLPHRMRDGYGIQPSHVERAVRGGAGLLVTVDCGTTADPALDAARDAGLPVVVIDHHLPGETCRDDVVMMNPRQTHCRYPFEDLCAAGLAFRVALAVCERWGRPLPSEALLRIACLGTIADMVPLRGENRIIAALGLRTLGETRSRGLQALFETARIRPPFAADDVGFRIGPRLNAAGRLDSAELALELLLTRDEARARELSQSLESLNDRRKREEERVVADATERVLGDGPDLPGILVAWDPGWHRGVVGIAASRLARRFHRPTLLLAVEGETATGSGRSVPDIHLHGFLAPWKDRLLRFGGHAQAVGLTARLTELPNLVEEWRDSAASFDADALTPVREYELELAPGECDLDLWRQLRRLEPHGQGNPAPLVRVGPMRLARPPRIFAERHLRGTGEADDGSRLSLLGWRWAERAERLEGSFEALGYLERDRRYGTLELRLVEARPHG